MAVKSHRNPIAELYGLIAQQAKKLSAPTPLPIPASRNHVISPVAVSPKPVAQEGLPQHTWFPIDPKRHNRTFTMFHAYDPNKTITLQCVEAPGHKGGCHYENPSNKKRKR